MKKLLVVLTVSIIASFVGPLFAEQTAYITDSLRLRVYANPDESSKVLETIDSGDSIELFESQGAFSKVRIYDGTVGWIKSAFIVEEPPAKLLYYSVSEQNKELKQQIEALQNSTEDTNSTENGQVDELQQALAEQQQLNQQLQEQLSAQVQNKLDQNTSERNQTITTTLATHNYSKYTIWLLGLAAALAILGFLFGIKISSLRMRKRLHGFRLD